MGSEDVLSKTDRKQKIVGPLLYQDRAKARQMSINRPLQTEYFHSSHQRVRRLFSHGRR